MADEEGVSVKLRTIYRRRYFSKVRNYLQKKKTLFTEEDVSVKLGTIYSRKCGEGTRP